MLLSRFVKELSCQHDHPLHKITSAACHAAINCYHPTFKWAGSATVLISEWQGGFSGKKCLCYFWLLYVGLPCHQQMYLGEHQELTFPPLFSLSLIPLNALTFPMHPPIKHRQGGVG